MSGLFHRTAPDESATSGYIPLISRRKSESQFLDFGLLRLRDGERHVGRTERDEVALVVLSGLCHLETDDHKWSHIGSRPHVFAGKPYACYVPDGSSFQVVGGPGGVEIAVCAVAGLGDGPRRSRMVIPQEVESQVRGAGAWRHTVHELIAMNVEAGRLLVGETVTPPGMWASYPPHKHDADEPPAEVRLEEIRHFRMEPEQGFGVQLAYHPGRRGGRGDVRAAGGDAAGWEEVSLVRDADTVRISRGYHATAAAPGYRMYALWVMAGEGRRYEARTDPDHAWLQQAEPMLREADRRL